LIRTI